MPKKREIGKPPDILVSARKVVLNALQEGMSLEGAAGLAGVSRSTFNEWRVIDRHFDDLIAHATAQFESRLVKTVVRSVDKDPKLAFEMLKARFPSKWGSGELRAREETRTQEQYERFQDHSLQANTKQLLNELDFRERMRREMPSMFPSSEEEE